MVEIHKLEKDSRDLSENAFDPIQTIDKDGKVLFMNKRWKEVFGYSDEDMKTRSVFDIIKSPDVESYKQKLAEADKKNKDQ